MHRNWVVTIILLLAGCHHRPAVIVSTGTVLGFELGQNPHTQMYSCKLGYVRGELAYVPLTNCNDVPDVITEMRFDGLPKGGFHQRLAVGKVACSQNASMLMFSRDNAGVVNEKILSLAPLKTNQDVVSPLKTNENH